LSKPNRIIKYAYLCRMKRLLTYFIPFLLFLTSLSACEKDDVCLEKGTPKLIIKFFDAQQTTLVKKIDNLSLIALPLTDTLVFKNVDSVAIPLNVNENNCVFKMIKGNNSDKVQFEYTTEEVFISKSCGYKSIFHNLQIDVTPDTDNWIKSIDIIKHNIIIDTVYHVKIFH